MLGINGGLIGPRRTTGFSGASGVWTPNEQVHLLRGNLWPSPAFQRYWQMDRFANTTLNNNTLDLTEIKFYENGILLSGITCTTSSGTGANVLVDGFDSDVSSRFLINANWSSVQSTFWIRFDFGQARRITSIDIRSLYTQPRFPASFVLSSSATNGSGYVDVAPVTVGTSFTALGGNVFSSGQVTVL